MDTVSILELTKDKESLYLANVKAHLMIFVYDKIKDMTQEDAAKKLKLTQPDISRLKNQRVSLFSVDKLLILSYRLGYTFKMSSNCILDEL